MKKRKIAILIILCSVFVLIGAGIVFVQKKESSVIQMNFNDSLSKLKVKDSDNIKMSFPKPESKYQIVFYLDTKCGSCIEQLETVRQLNEVLKTESTDIKILWEDRIDKGLLNEYEIPVEDNYVMDKGKLDVVTPTGFIVDGDTDIIFSTFDLQKLFKKYLSLEEVSGQKILENTNVFLEEEAVNIVPGYVPGKELLLYFTTGGCLGCEQAEQIVYSEKIKEKYNVLTVWTPNTADIYQGIKDTGDLFSNVYEIVQYPTFIKSSSDSLEVISGVENDLLERALLEEIVIK